MSGIQTLAVLVVVISLALSMLQVEPARAATSLRVTPIAWNVIGLDSNNVNVGPNHFPIGARVCNTGASIASNVQATFAWDSSNSFIYLRPGTVQSDGSPYTHLPTSGTINLAVPADPNNPELTAGACTDFYFEVEVARNSSAYDTTREYHITVTADGGATTASTPTPRELYVEHLVSQNRNTVSMVEYGETLGSLSSVPAGGTMSLLVGKTYYIKVTGSTATNGYEQSEAFLTLPNTIFEVLSASTTYTADSSAYVNSPNDKVYGDACRWDANPLSPNYRSCLDVGKVGGGITVIYQVEILSAPISPLVNPEPLSTLVYDFSGSSYHYNSDFSVSGRYVEIVDPSQLTISKSFNPAQIVPGGVSALTFTITNPFQAAATDVNFVDTFPTSPAAMTVASPLTVSNTCGGTLQDNAGGALAAGDAGVKLISGSVPAKGSCLITVNVTAPTASGTPYSNISNNLYIGSLDTGNRASADLTVSTAPPAPASTCNIEMVTWDFSSSLTPTFKSSLVSTANATYYQSGVPANDLVSSVSGGIWTVTSNGGGSGVKWPEVASGSYPANGTAPYIEFSVDSSQFTGVKIQFDFKVDGNWAAAANNHLYVWTNSNGGAFDGTPQLDFTPLSTNTWYTQQVAAASATGATSTISFRINEIGAKSTGTMPYIGLDNVKIFGCRVLQPPTITKSFSPASVAVGGTATLSFLISNPNDSPSATLTGLNFNDYLPDQELQGTLSVTNGSPLVSGTGTAFMSQLVNGSVVTIPDEPVAITGSISVNNGSYYVTGTGTLFTSELVEGGGIRIGSAEYVISDILSDTSLVLADPYQGSNLVNGSASRQSRYTVSSILSDTSLVLSSNYAGVTASGVVASSGLTLASVPVSTCRGSAYGAIGGDAISISGDRLNGTISVTNGSTAVIGRDTLFTSQLSPGSRISINSVYYRVNSITDDTHLTLSTAYGGTTASGLIFTYYVTPLQGTVSVTGNSATVNGTGTAFLSQLVSGDVIYIRGTRYTVSVVNSNAQLTLTAVYSGIANGKTESGIIIGANYILEGTTSTTAGSATVTGTGTLFKTELKAGDVIYIGSTQYTIASVSSNTSLTLTTAASLTASGQKISKQDRLGLTGGGSATCEATVTVKANMGGVRTNISDPITSIESGYNITSTGYATADLTAVMPPVISKQFSPNPILSGAGNVTTLTFTVTNPNPSTALSGLTFTDTFPSGMTVAASPSASSTCGGTFTFTPSAAVGSISFPTTGTATLAAGATCTVQVNVTAPTATTALSGTVTVTNGSKTVSGAGTAFNTELAVGRTIYINSTKYQVESIASATTMTLTVPYAGTTQSGVTITGGYFNKSGNVAHTINGSPVSGNFASDTLMVKAPVPALSFKKQIGTSASGPWYDSIIAASGSDVYYRFTVENIGDVPLSPVSVNDPDVSTSGCTWTDPLPVATAANDNHITTCVVGPISAISGVKTNTARAQGTYGGSTYYSNYDSASYQNGNFGHLPYSTYTNMNVYGEGGAFSLNGSSYLGTRRPGLGADPAETDGSTSNTFVPEATDDGVSNTPAVPWKQGTVASGNGGSVDLIVTCASSPCYINAWMDFNGDGDFNDPGEQIFTNRSVSSGSVTLTFDIPVSSAIGDFLPDGTYYSRFRLTDQSVTSPSPYSTARNGSTVLVGEIEDNSFSIVGGVTTPVTLSYFEARPQGSVIHFDWSTLTESGNIGFNLYALQNGRMQKLNEQLIPSQGVDSLHQQDYAYSVATDASVFYLEEVDLTGKGRRHGPFTLGETYGARGEASPIDWQSIAETNSSKTSAIPQLTVPAELVTAAGDVTAPETLEEEQSLPSSVQPACPVNAKSLNPVMDATLNLIVNQSGLYRVTYEQLLAAGLDLKGVSSTRIMLTNQGKAVPIYIKAGPGFGPGAYFEFYGQALDTLYTSSNIYTLQVGRKAVPRIPVQAIGIGRTKPAASYTETSLTNRQIAYANYAPGADPWYDTEMLVFTTPQTWDFPLQADGLTSGPATLRLTLWGVTDWPQNNDHHLLVRVNGTLLANETFDGLTEKNLTLNLPDGLLHEGENTLQITLPGDAGVEAELVTLDQYSLSYPRLFKAQNGQLKFESAGKVFQVADLPSKNVVVYRQDRLGWVKLSRIQVQAEGDTFTATFAGTGKPATYYVSAVEALPAPAFEPTSQVVSSLDTPAQYLVIAHPNFIEGLQPLIEARQAQGLTVSVVNVDDIYTRYSYGILDPKAIQKYIAYAVRNLGTQYVLLVGGDTYDYRDYLGIHSVSYIPSLYVRTGPIAGFVPADPLFADVNNDRVPDVPIGRFPVRTQAELNLVVQKTLAYQSKTYGRTALFASDRSDGAISFKSISDTMADRLPTGWSAERINLDDMTIKNARTALINGMNRGVALVTFTGHSDPQSWTFDNLFTLKNAMSLTNAGKPFVVVQWGCWNNYYVDPLYNYLVQGFLVSGDRGAAAVLGATTLADSESELALGQFLTPRLVTPGMTIGDALQQSKAQLAKTSPQLLDVILGWSLMGDPALIIEPYR